MSPHYQYSVTSPYGPRPSGFHTGVDLRTPQGTPLYAAFDGIIRWRDAGPDSYGWYVKLEAGRKVAYYAHLSARLVPDGARVKAGQLIARSGGKPESPGAGNSTGDHLHFEVRIDNHYVDPQPHIGETFHPAAPSSPEGVDVILFRIKGDGRVWWHMGNWRQHVDGGTYKRFSQFYGAPADPNKVPEFSAEDGWGQLPESPP